MSTGAGWQRFFPPENDPDKKDRAIVITARVFPLFALAVAMSCCTKDNTTPSTEGPTPGAITGIVSTPPSVAVAEAVIRIEPETSRDTTDASGVYTLVGIVPGTYMVISTATGFFPESTTVAVSSSSTVTGNISMTSSAPTNGLILYLPFNGNANDASGRGNHGIIAGATLTTDRAGYLNRAYAFDGINNNISFPDLIPDTITAFTMSAWIFANDAGRRRVALYSGANRGEAQLEIIDSSFSFTVDIYNVGWFPTFSRAVAGQFVHLVGVYRRGDRSQLWVDGVLKSEISLPMGTLNHGRSTHTSSVGSYAPQWLDWGRQNGIEAWQGTVDQVRIYTRALSQTEIQLLYASGQ